MLYYRPYQRPHPPIAVAATGRGSDTIRLAGERGWIPMSAPILLPPDLRSHWEMMEERAASAKRQAQRSQWRIVREVHVGETPVAAREEARVVLGRPFEEHQLPFLKALGLLEPLKLDPSMTDEAVNVDYMMDHVWIVGNPQECADKIRTFYNDVGGFGTLLIAARDPDDYWLAQRSIRLLMEEVGPRLKDLE